MSRSFVKSSVDVQIAGETYTIRSEASPEHTRQCASYLDSALKQVMRESSIVEVHKAVILAALSITDELFRSQEACKRLQSDVRARAARLADEVRAVRTF